MIKFIKFEGTILTSPRTLFILSLIALLSTYLFVFGQEKTLQMISTEYLFILAVIPLTLAYLFFKFKLKGYELINFNKNNSFSLKSTIVFFLIFQVVDYVMEDGFIGMISQWFIYWVFAVIAWLVTNNINFYKNHQFYKYESMSDKRL